MTAAPDRSRWLRRALVVSLALNLAVAGVAGGAWLRGATAEAPGRDRMVVRDIGFGPWSRALSEADHAALRRGFEAERPRMREAWRAERADRAELLALLRADPLDLDAAHALFDRIDGRNSERLDFGQRLIRAHIVAMTPEERADFADRMEAAMQRRGPRGEGRGRPPGGG